MARFLDNIGLAYFWEKIKAWIPFLSRKTQSIPFGQVDSTSTSTVFTATVDGITELRDGVCCYIRNGVVTSATGCTLNINGLGAKPMYYTTSSTGRVTSHFNINYTWLFVYNSTRIDGGCWDSYWGYNSEYNLSQNYIYIGRINVGDYPTSAYSLGAFDVNGKWTPFVTTATTSTGKSLVQSVFPIGAKIYRDSASRSNNTSYNDVYLYTTLSNNDLRYSSVNHNQAIFPNYNFNRVFMPVIVNAQDNTFTLTTQTTSGYNNNFTNERNLNPNNFYIEIGFNSGSSTSYYFTLICENNLYYYDGKSLIDYHLYKTQLVNADLSNKADKVVGATNGNFAGLDSTGNLTDSGYKPSDFITQHQHIPEYTIEKLTQAETSYSASYVLKKDNVQVGATINIPKDMVVSSGEVKTVTTANVPYQGAQVGDKYIDLTIANTSQNHIYIPVKDLVDVYVAGNGIRISDNNYISIVVDSNNANGLGVGGSGLALYHVTPSVNGSGGSDGAMLATDKEKLDGIEAGAEENVIETVKVSGTALQVTDKSVNIVTETAYDPTTNKIATMSDVESATPSIPNYKIEELANPTSGFRSSYRLEKDGSTISGSDTIDIPTEFSPLVSKEYTGTDFYAASNTWNNSSRYFMSVRPDALKEYWYVKYRVRVWIPSDTTEKRFTDSIIEYFGSGISMKGYRIWNTINTSSAAYYQVAYWLTNDGYNNQNPTDPFGHVLGTSILYGTNYTTSSWYRHVKVDLLAYEGCEVNMFDNLVKWSEYKTSTGATSVATGVEHPDYGTTDPSTYNATSQGLQETGDTTDITNIYLNYARFTAGTYGLMRYSLMMQDSQGKWQSFTTNSGTGATKTKNPSAFRLGSHIYQLVVSNTDYVANAIIGTGIVRAYGDLIDFRYTLNITTTAGGANNLVPYKPLFIVGTLGNDGLFYLDDVWWTQDEPVTEDGKIYIKVSPAIYNDYTNDRCYRGDLLSDGYAYWYKNGRFQRYYDVDWKANDEDVVHKAGAETITGEKTFEANVNLTGLPTGNNHATNKIYVDSTIQEAIEGIEGNFTTVSARIGEYTIFAHALVAFASKSPLSSDAKQMELTPFTQTGGTSSKTPIVNTWFPIGCKIYYNNEDEAGPSGQVSVAQKKLYLTHKNVDARYSAITGSNVSLGYGFNNTVYLRVMVEDGYWSPYYKSGETNEIIVSANQLVTNNYYIYLGKTVGSAVSDVQTFELEDNNQLYYYNGTDLIDYATRISDIGSSSVLPSGGTTGQVLAKVSNADNDVEWVNQSTGVTDYDDLDDKPQINGVTLSGNKTSSQLGLQSELTFDNTPTANSNNPVKSGGVKTALDAKQDTLVSGTNIKTVNNTSLLGSGNIQINDGVGFQTITTQQDGTMQITLTNGDTITVDLNHVHPQYYSKVMESVMPQGGFLPDVVYSLGVLSSNITFALAPAVVGNTNHYYWTFSTATTAITVTWPTKLIWANGNVPTIAANKHYEISILDSIAVYMETSIRRMTDGYIA